MKRLALLIVLMMVLSSVDSCTQEAGQTPAADSSAEQVTLTWYYRGNGEQADTRKVNDYVNEQLKSYEGLEHVSIELHPNLPADYAQNVLLAQTSGAQLDILNTVSLSLFEQVSNGTYIPLDDYMPLVPELSEALPDWLFDLGRMNGSLYIIPHYQQAANMHFMAFPKAYADKYLNLPEMAALYSGEGGTIAEKLDALEAYTLAVREGEGKVAYPFSGIHLTTADSWQNFSYDTIPNSDNLFHIKEGTNTVTFAPYEEDTITCYEYAAKWWESGLLAEDPTAMTTFGTRQLMLEEFGVAAYVDQYMGGTIEEIQVRMAEVYGFEVVTFPLRDYIYYIPYVWAAGGDGVTASCDNPEEAIKFIEAMNNERGIPIYNTIVYGIEGVHYEKIDDTHIRTFGYDSTQGTTDYLYSAHKWIMGNTFNAYLNQGVSDSDNALALSINENPDAKKSTLMGFVFDPTNVVNEMGQIVAVWREYRDGLDYGLRGSEWQAYYDELISKCEAAGVQKVLDEIQGQIDAFLQG